MTKERNITELVPNKKYRIDIESGRKLDGTRNRIVEVVNGPLRQAIDRRDELKYEIKHSKIKPNSSMTFLDYSKLWLRDYAEVNIKKSTLAGYKSSLNYHILPRFKDYKLSDITVYEIERFYNDLRKKQSGNITDIGKHTISESTVRHQHSLLCVMLNTAVKWDFIEYNPCLKLTKPPIQRRNEMSFYDEKEIQLLFQYLDNENLTFKTAVYLLVLGGFRRGECLGLMWEDIHFESETITIRNNLISVQGQGVYLDTPKTNKSKRTVSVPTICFQLLRELNESQSIMKKMCGTLWQDTSFVFKSEYGTFYNPNRLSRNWRAFIKKYNLKRIRLHDLRHTCATYLLSHNTPVATVSKKLGHSNIYTTLDTYTHSVDSDDVEASKLLNDMAINATKES